MGVEEECVLAMGFRLQIVVDVKVLKVCDVILVLDFDASSFVEGPISVTTVKFLVLGASGVTYMGR